MASATSEKKMLLFLLSLFLFSSTVQGKGYTVVVKTSGDRWAGTDATVKIRVRGTKSQIDRALPGAHEDFERDGINTFTLQDYDVGRVKEMDVYRDDSGLLPDWKLDWIKIKIAGVPDSIFKYYDWVKKNHWTQLTLSCSQGFKVNNQGYCDVEDVDECLVNNPCIFPATCRNIVGSYACDCPNGYEQKSQNECQDKNECTQNPCNNVKSDCKNFAGGYSCDCQPGYESVNPTTCQNVNECAKQNTHSCNSTASTCVDSEPGYWCDCKPGYIRGVNNKICDAISCGFLARPAGSTLEPARCTQANANVYGDRCVMKCKVGYVISDVSHGILRCGSSGRWEGTMGTCNAVTCPKLAPISNGDLLPSTCKSIGGKYRRTCTYYCANGYQLVGTAHRECQADGTWDEAEPTCKKVVAKPWISCPDLIQQDLLPGKSTADVSSVWKEPTSNVHQITISPPEISSSYQFPVGSTRVTWTASNEMGSDSCSIYVMIYDREDPTVTNCPTRIAKISDGPKVVTWVEPTFSDNVKVTKEVKSSTSGSIFQLGSTYVTYIAYDAAGNSVQCRFEVELKRADCHEPDGPVGGTKSCTTFGNSKFCQITCPSGSQLYKGTTTFWTCNNGAWAPSDHIPDCVEAVKKDPNTVCQETQIKMTASGWQGAVLYCAKCPTGMHKSSRTDCSPCPAGTYNDQQGQLQCTLKCPTGTSTVPGAKSANDCKPKCSAGQFSNNGLGPNCQYCPVDTYQDKDQQTNCMPCPNGTHTLALGADSLSKCGARPVVTKIEPKIANIDEKEDVSVNCYASGIPTPFYTWKFLKENIPPEFLGKMSQSSIRNAQGEVIGAKFTITGATHENTGSYECKVTNTHGENQDLAQINVAPVLFPGSGADEPL